MTKISDEAVTAFDRAYMACAESHAGGDKDTSERCCIAAGLASGVRVVIVEQVDAAGPDEGAFMDWVMDEYAAPSGGPTGGTP